MAFFSYSKLNTTTFMRWEYELNGGYAGGGCSFSNVWRKRVGCEIYCGCRLSFDIEITSVCGNI
jgi:hypothetical protein